MRNKKLFIFALVFVLATFIGEFPAEGGYYKDLQRKGFDISGKIETRVSSRTESSEGFTSPEVDAGDIVQHRNLLHLEVNHDLTKDRKMMGWRARYHLLGRALYEGIYDYGPDQYEDLPDDNWVEDIDDFKYDIDLWEGYIDLSKKSFFCRLGRQNLAWGETDLVRLLDNINPLDNTFGGIFEDLDDRRIPLWMARASNNFGRLGPFQSISLEGFWVPGSIDAQESPLAPPGTPYALPVPPISALDIPGVVDFYEHEDDPEREMNNSRWGARLQGYLGGLNWALAYQKTFLDTPTPRFVVDRQFDPTTGTPAKVALNYEWEQVDIFGASFNSYEPHLDLVLRSEIAYLVDVPFFIPEVAIPGPTVSPTGVLQFNTGEIIEEDQLRYSMSIDKDIWIRPLCKNGQFSFTLQYSGTYTYDHEDEMMYAIPDPDDGEFDIEMKEYEQTYVFVAMNTSGWLNGDLLPTLTCAYNPRGAFFFQPQLEYLFDPWRATLQYSNISGNFVDFGFFEDRDQVTLTLGLQW